MTASRRVLRPLVRLLMRAGVTFPVFADLVRQLYVEVALTDLLRDPKSRTDSRVSLLTGVHRKEIRRLRGLPADADPIPPAVTIGSQAIGRWLSLPDYTMEDGTPLSLPRASKVEGDVSFDGLIAAITTDVRPRAVLDDWLGQGLVTVDEADRVHLNTAAFLPRGGGAEQMFYFARNLADHVTAATANVSAPGSAPFIDRSVHYDRLNPATVSVLEQIARKAAQKALLEVNRAALAMTSATPDQQTGEEPAGRINFGVYIYSTDGDEAEAGTP